MNEQKSLSDQRAAMHATRASLESRLEAAQLASKQDILRASLQTSLLSKPVAQRDAAGGMAFLLYAAGPLLGLAIGILLSVFAKNQDHTLRTPLEVEQRLGVPVLAVLPKMETPRVSRTRIGGGGESGQSSLPPG